ncbi:hypothetical protein ACFXKV_10055 [Streptomyces globisporus]|uniref:hypothetical protein n=1 Tax=Streptomyces globisporus TaxID=1908 RepID=UPI00363CF7B6
MTPEQYSHIRAHLANAARQFGGIDYVSPVFGLVRDAMAEVDRLRAELAFRPSRIEVQLEAATWLRSVGETDAACLLSTCDVWVTDETHATHGSPQDLRPGVDAARQSGGAL